MRQKNSNSRENPLTGWPEVVGQDEYEYVEGDHIPDWDVIPFYGKSKKKRSKWEKWRQLPLFPGESTTNTLF